MRILAPMLLALVLAACGVEPEPRLPPPRTGGELVVLTVALPGLFFEDDRGGHGGLEYDLVTLFAEAHGYRVRFLVRSGIEEIVPALAGHRAHLAAAGLRVTAETRARVRFGPAYRKVQPQVAYNADESRPGRLADLSGGTVAVPAGSGYAALLSAVSGEAPGLKWEELPVSHGEALLARVAEGAVPYAVADAHQVEIARNFYPNVAPAFDLGEPMEVAWAMPMDADPVFVAQVQTFFARITADGTLKRLFDRYYGHVRRLSAGDVERFLARMQTVLPRYRPLFRRAEELTGIDWRLIAALGYQESQWDPLATSFTNVRGLMMLTEDTADRMKVSDRLDAEQSILAGARYLADLHDQLPDSVPEPDRLWLALAAYNLGFGHLQGARALARSEKLSPDLWVDMKKMLPLLSRPEYAARLKSGAARGGEAVVMTENIRTYYDILRRHQRPHTPAFRLPRDNVLVLRDEDVEPPPPPPPPM